MTAEQHYKDSRALEKAQEDDGSGYRFDSDLCRKIFDEFDRDGSGYLDLAEISKLAEVVPLYAACLAKFRFESEKMVKGTCPPCMHSMSRQDAILFLSINPILNS